MKKLNNQGFGVFEIIAGLAILALIVTAGWFVYKSHHTVTDAPMAAMTTAKLKTTTTPKPVTPSSTPVKPVTKSTNTTSVSQSQTTDNNKNIVKIPELGIQITVPDSIKDLVYAPHNVTLSGGKPATYAFFSTKTLTSEASGCSVNSGPLGSLERAGGQYPTNDPTAFTELGALVKQYPTFYISAGYPQAACSQNSAANKLAETQKGIFDSSFSTITQLTN